MSTLGIILIVILILWLCFGGHVGANWWSGTSGVVGLLLVVILILVLLGKI